MKVLGLILLFGVAYNQADACNGGGCCCAEKCSAHVALVVDRSGSVPEIDNVKTFMKNLLDDLEPCRFTVAVTAYAANPQVFVEFTDAAAIDRNDGKAAIDTIPKASGDSHTSEALDEIRDQMVVNEKILQCRNKVVVLFTDGGSDNKPATEQAAEDLAAAVPDSWICVVGMEDPAATDQQKCNRLGEFDFLQAVSNQPNSLYLGQTDFTAGVPGQVLIDKIKNCICQN